MMKKVFDEASLFLEFQQKTVDDFLAHIAQYDEEQSDYLLRQGYKLNKRDKRTVLFTFGEVSFYRNRWTKDGQQFIPVDVYLGLEKYSRYSTQLVYEISRLSTFTSYRKVVDIVKTTYKLDISKNIVSRAVEEAGRLLEERESYRFYEEQQEVDKIQSNIIYVEGDGVMVKVVDESSETTVNMDLSHFLVHTGSQEVSKNRFALENKRTFIGENNYQVRRQVQDYLYNHFEITDDTLLVSNSDHGSGYTPYVFEDLAKSLGIKHHEHFWDRYHLYKLIEEHFKPYSEELSDLVIQAVMQHDRSKLKLAINTVESLILTEDEAEWFGKFAERLMRDFKYTKPPQLRGLPTAGIGVMETQHRKLTYRMKRQGRYWSRQGAVTMSKLILLTYEDQLKDIFFGNWRKEYVYYQELENIPISSYLKETKKASDYYLKGKLHGNYKP